MAREVVPNIDTGKENKTSKVAIAKNLVNKTLITIILGSSYLKQEAGKEVNLFFKRKKLIDSIKKGLKFTGKKY